VAAEAAWLGVHALAQGDPGQLALARLFGEHSGDETDKFARCAWTEGPHGVPLLAGAPRRLVGRILNRIDLGDHVGYLLDPVRVEEAEPITPLGLAGLPHLTAGHPAEERR
jgi:flavin reductase (DIM6/NTAB) family NADH-FMN oxidoreductase RutF